MGVITSFKNGIASALPAGWRGISEESPSSDVSTTSANTHLNVNGKRSRSPDNQRDKEVEARVVYSVDDAFLEAVTFQYQQQSITARQSITPDYIKTDSKTEECQLLIQETDLREQIERDRVWKEVKEAARPRGEGQAENMEENHPSTEWLEENNIRLYLKKRVERLLFRFVKNPQLGRLTPPESRVGPEPRRTGRSILVKESIHIKDYQELPLLVKVNGGLDEISTALRHGTVKSSMFQPIEVSTSSHLPSDAASDMKDDGYVPDLGHMHHVMSLWHEAIDEKEYSKGRERCSDKGELSEVMEYQSFVDITILNRAEVPMRQEKEPVPNSWEAFTCIGNFLGGDFCLPELEINLKFLPGDVIFLRSGILKYSIGQVSGKRTILIFHNYDTLKSIAGEDVLTRQEEGMPEFQRAVVRKSVWDTRSQQFRFAEEDLGEDSSPVSKDSLDHTPKKTGIMTEELPPYPTKRGDLSTEQLAKAQRRKHKFLQFARSEAKLGEVGLKEVEKIESTPVEAFYQLNFLERYRHKMGHYPFKPMGRLKRKRQLSKAEDL